MLTIITILKMVNATEKPTSGTISIRNYASSVSNNSYIPLDMTQMIGTYNITVKATGNRSSKHIYISDNPTNPGVSTNDERIIKLMDDYSSVTNKEYTNLIDYPNEEELRFISCSTEEFDKEYRRFIAERQKNGTGFL